MKKCEPVDPAAPRRGRPRTFDRAKALDVAMRLFWSKGYDATSISDLTEAIGIAATSLYAAFGSKDELYAEALKHYGETYRYLVWDEVVAQKTARGAVRAYLMNSAAALTGSVLDLPRGCMGTHASVGEDAHPDLAAHVRRLRASVFTSLEERLRRATIEGDLPAWTDIAPLARFIQMVHGGLSILARDGASRADLEASIDVAMAGWDAVTAAAARTPRKKPMRPEKART